MIKFGLDDYIVEFGDWSKPHKKLSVHVKRVYADGKTVDTTDQLLKEVAAKNEGLVLSKRVILASLDYTDFYLPLTNLEYIEPNVKFFSIGCSQTAQSMYVRLKFMLLDSLFIVEDVTKTCGPYAPTFKDCYLSEKKVVKILDELVDSGKSIEEIGIMKGDDADYHIKVASGEYAPKGLDVTKKELMRSLIAVEVCKYDQIFT